MTEIARYDIYINTKELGTTKAADCALVEENNMLVRFGFRYSPDYLEHPSSFSLDPTLLPLNPIEQNLNCRQGIPGILDDYLPDDWGRKVLSQLAFYQQRRNLNQYSCIDILSALSDSRIGALQWVPKGDIPSFALGADISKLAQAEHAAQTIDEPNAYPEQLDELSLVYLANAGTGVGGARPKALIYDDAGVYLAKFNRLSLDAYNNARVELACLRMANEAGIEVYQGKVVEGVNEREALLLDRFDLEKQNSNTYRRHLITVNALLKDKTSQRDRGGAFRYDDITDLIRRFSTHVERDLTQLLKMMLFNQSINNTDTHERNFSFLHEEDGYRLAPAYDMVPSLVTGQYPAAGFQYSPTPPLSSETSSLGKIFGLPKTTINNIADEVTNAVEKWQTIANATGVRDAEIEAIAKKIRI